MSNRLSDDANVLLLHLQQTLEFTNNLKERCKRVEEERDSAVTELSELKSKYEQLRAKSLIKGNCKECRGLKEQLSQQRRVAKETQARLKSVASLLNFEDSSQKNQLTEAQCALVSQMLGAHDESDSFGDHNDGGNESVGNSSNELQKRRESFSLLSGVPVEVGSDTNILVPETVQYEDEDVRNVKTCVTIPETQVEEENVLKEGESCENVEGAVVQEQASEKYSTEFIKLVENKVEKFRAARLNRSVYRSTDAFNMIKNEVTKEQLKSDTTGEPDMNKHTDNKETNESSVLRRISPENRLSLKTRSVSQKRNSDGEEKPLKENIDSSSSSSDSSICLQVDHKHSRLLENERIASFWKLKPGHAIESDVTSGGDVQRKKKKLTQTKLSVASFNRRHDVSSFENFNGGVASTSTLEDNENDIILPSPNKKNYKKFSQARRQQVTKENRTENSENGASLTSGCKPLSMDSNCDREDIKKDIATEDMDETLFNPAITSTCKPAAAVDSSFDRIPEVSNSPPYKYRRNIVRKKDERMKLPGQQCNDCAKFFEAAGFSKDERQKAMNACSRHRDKYPIMYNSPPGFWDPDIPESPE